MHILTPRSTVPTPEHTSTQWHTETLLVNQFRQDEWPHQDLAPLRDLSLGEEQSESFVVSLAWSPPGLGLHKRSVLAILTSNLVLSLWESNGMPGSWRRTHIVNPNPSESDAGSAGFKRRSQRIRAFVWLPALKYPSTSKWGTHWLLIVDDNNILTCLHVQKDNPPSSEWRMNTIYQRQLWTSERPGLDIQVSLLQNLLISQSPTAKITAGRWQMLKDEEESTQLFRIRLSFRRGTAEGPPPDHSSMLEVEPTAAGLEFTWRTLSPETTTKLDNLTSAEEFEAGIARLVEDFSGKHNLEGHVRVRKWGFASLPARHTNAACITLHPLDMIEDQPPSGGKTIVVLAASERISSTSPPAVQCSPPVKILSWLRTHASKENAKSKLDEKVVRVASSAIYAAFSHDDDLMMWSRSVESMLAPSPNLGKDAVVDTQMTNAANESPSHGSPFVPASPIAESCEICDSEMSMASDLSSAHCSNGHSFTRCAISFLAIQEPGISKYCSQCGKQFLDLWKLESPSGPCLVQALFEEFDVCPYCQGRFRG